MFGDTATDADVDAEVEGTDSALFLGEILVAKLSSDVAFTGSGALKSISTLSLLPRSTGICFVSGEGAPITPGRNS